MSLEAYKPWLTVATYEGPAQYVATSMFFNIGILRVVECKASENVCENYVFSFWP